MVHHIVVSLIVLRVLFCPMLCMATGDVAQASVAPDRHESVCHCHCSTSQDLSPASSDTGHEEHCPTPSQCPCDESCMCHALSDAPNKIRQLSFGWSLSEQLDAVSIDDICSSFALPNNIESSTGSRPDLSSGIALRLVIASLLL